MTVQISPAAELNQKNDTTTGDSVEARISNVTELVDSAITIYENQQIRINQMDDPATKLDDLSNGPWRDSAFAAEETRVVDGVAQRVTNNRLQTNSVWDFMFNNPIRFIYDSPNPEVASTIVNPVDNIQRERYDSIFREHLQRIKIPGGVQDSVNNAVSQLNNLNTVGYQNALTQATNIIVEPMLSELIVLRDIINAVNNEINNPQSVIYKPGGISFGPYTTNTISSFQMPPLMLEIRDGINALISILREIYNRIDEIVNLPQDVLARISLLNTGLEQNPNNPNEFSMVKPQEKDPWGIRFTYTSQQAGNLFAQQRQVNEFTDVASRNATGINRRNNNQRQQELQASRDILEQTTINLQKDFYFQLLPAIKSNLPVSGGTDVPGAMPGIQFRIENNIVKHKIPGFAPVYQPIGIDSIKCTLVGMFTGSDGLDLSANYLQDLSAGLLNRGQNLPVGSKQEYSIAKNGPTLSAFDSSNNPYLNGEIDPRNNPLVFNDGVDIPIPSQSRSRTASPVAVISEDAFRGAQDFYNEIVSQGREVEVELNLRKGTGAYPGGSVGPFRDPETGNPKFKGLIRRLDLYYVRRDRCWFIIDLEITDSGLIGKECLNLTNVIEESIDLFEGVAEPLGLTKEQLDKCFKDPIEMPLKGEDSGKVFVVDQSTGLSYFYSSISNQLLSDQTYPLSFEATMAYLFGSLDNDRLDNVPSTKDVINSYTRAASVTVVIGNVFTIADYLRDKKARIAALMLRLAALYEPTLTSKDNDFANTVIPSTAVKGINFHGTAWRYNKNLGKFFYVYENNSELVRDVKVATERARTLKDLLYDRELGLYDGGGAEKAATFVLQEYVPLLKIPDNDCTKLLEEIEKESFNKQDDVNGTQSINSPLPLPEQLTSSIPGNNTNLTSSPLPQVDVFETENVDNENFIPPEAIDSIENGVLNRLIEQSLNEYLKVLDRDQPAFVGTSLSHELTTTLKPQVRSNQLYTTNISNVNLTLVNNRTRVRKNETNSAELSIGIRFTTNKPFYMFRNNNFYKFETGFSFTSRVIVKSYLQNNTKVYKTDSVVIGTPRTLAVEAPVEPVQTAPQNLEPSASNNPSTSQPG